MWIPLYLGQRGSYVARTPFQLAACACVEACKQHGTPPGLQIVMYRMEEDVALKAEIFEFTYTAVHLTDLLNAQKPVASELLHVCWRARAALDAMGSCFPVQVWRQYLRLGPTEDGWDRADYPTALPMEVLDRLIHLIDSRWGRLDTHDPFADQYAWLQPPGAYQCFGYRPLGYEVTYHEQLSVDEAMDGLQLVREVNRDQDLDWPLALILGSMQQSRHVRPKPDVNLNLFLDQAQDHPARLARLIERCMTYKQALNRHPRPRNLFLSLSQIQRLLKLK